MSRWRPSILIVSVVLATLLLATPARAADPEVKALESQIDTMRGDVMERRESALKVLIPLDGEQATAFWPLKAEYDDELKKIGKAREALFREYVKNSKTITAEQAKDFAARSLKLDEDRLALRRKYFDLMSEKVSPVAAAQFLQLERQFETMMDFKVQAVVPLAGS